MLPVIIYNAAKITKKAKYGNIGTYIHKRFISIFLKDLYTNRNINNTNILTKEIFTTDMKLFTNEVGTGSDFYNVKITKNM